MSPAVFYLAGVLAFVGALAGARRLRARDVAADGGYGSATVPESRDRMATVFRWVSTVDHKDIGILYLLFATFAALWGGMDSMMMRTELLTPPADVWMEETYNGLFTTHGTTMLFFFVTPAFFGIANYVLPLLIGADDLAFPRLNAIGFWLLPPALLLVRGGLVTEVVGKVLALVAPRSALTVLFALKPPAIGWTMYAPLSVQTANPQVDFFLLGLHLSGISTTIGAINFITTIVTERAPAVGWEDLDIFTWSMLTTSGIILFAFPLLGSAIVMLLLDRNFGTAFYAVGGGGPLLWQHLFWFFGHPEVYIIFLPATGLMSTILPKFSARKIFGFEFIVYSTLAIGVLSFGVWAHHMFTTGIDPRILSSFMAVSIAIAVPSAVKTFNWITTIWKGQIRLTAPMLFCVGGIALFVVGGITGVFLAAIPIDVLYQDTYYVVGHFHLILMAIIPFMMMAASYYWFPLLTDRMYDRRLARIQAVLMFVGAFVAFGSMILLGVQGMPRRYASYPAEFTLLHRVASFGAYVIGASVLLWAYNVLRSYAVGERVQTGDPWDLKRTGQFTREWQELADELAERGVETPEPDERIASSADLTEDEGSPEAVGDVEGLVRDALVGAAGGLVGILSLSVVMLVAAVAGVFEIPDFASVARLFGVPDSALAGYLVVVALGMGLWSLVFVAVAEKLPGEEVIPAGMGFGLLLVPGFLVAFYSGQAGLELVGYVSVSLVGHLAYGFGLGAVFERYGDRLDTSI